MGKVIFVMVDALGYETATKRAGYLEHLVTHNKAAKYKMQGDLPAASRPMYETLMTGLPAWMHGVTMNDVVRESRCENIFSLCKKQGLVTAAAAFGWICELYTGKYPFDPYTDRILDQPRGNLDCGIFYQNCDYPDSELYADGEYLRKKYHPDFLRIHPMNVDTIGHGYGCLSKENQGAADASFQQIARLCEDWREDGYDVIVTGDHGMDTLGLHGGNEAVQRDVPLYILSDQVKKGDFTDHEISNLQAAPLVCRLLGIPLSEGMIQENQIEMEN